MEEAVKLDASIPIRQGDIFLWKQGAHDPWRVAGIVMTADCDIAQGKVHDFVSYVPIFPLTHYVDHIWAVRKLKRLEEQHFREFAEFILKKHQRLNPQATMLTPFAIKDWIRRESAETIAELLGESDPKEIEKFRKNQHLIGTLILDGLDESVVLSPFSALCRIREFKNGHKPDKIATQAYEELSNDPPLDVAFLCGLEQFSLPTACAVMLRDLYPLAIKNLTTSMTDFRDGQAQCLRVARLTPQVRYSITQQFATLFSRIGLPSEYEQKQKDALRNACHGLIHT